MNQNDEFLLSKINELERKVFELEKRVKTLEDEKVAASSIELNEAPSDEDKTNTRTERYSFDGEVYKKNRLVLAVVSKYIKTHPGITADELSKAFPAREFKSSYACVMDINLIPEKQIKPVKRYFVDDLITLADGTKVAVCTQWGNNTKLFIDYATNKYGYVIEPATLNGNIERYDDNVNDADYLNSHIYLEWDRGFHSFDLVNKHESHFVIRDRKCTIAYMANRIGCGSVTKTINATNYRKLISLFIRHYPILSDESRTSFEIIPFGGGPGSFKYDFNGKSNLIGVPSLFKSENEILVDQAYDEYNKIINDIFNQ